eukprot:jgi/Orpsp1_1/1184700/evm.model.c7180000090632.2
MMIECFFCKNDICVLTKNDYSEHVIEFPDQNNNTISYIIETCAYDKIIANDCNSIKNCTTDSECLSNKCFNNFCAFNEENPIVHCDNIYTGGRTSYMYCGKAYGDTCKTNEECSSLKCSDYGYCKMQTNGPSDSESMAVVGYLYILLILLAIILIIAGCCYCCIKSAKKYKHIEQ